MFFLSRWGGFSLTLGSSFSHRTHRFNRPFLRTVSNPQDSGPSPNPSPAGRGVVCEVTPIRLLTQFLGSFISHRTHRFNRTFWRTISIPQKASGIQNSQNVSAIVDTEQGVTGSLHPRHRGISVITPLPFGGGAGGGANFLVIILSYRDGAELEARRGPSAFENMLFLVQEGRLQRARRAWSYVLSITF